MKVSVIVCARNEEKMIEKCMKCLVNQTVKPEIIVVDGHSKDNTVKIAKKYADKVVYDNGKGIYEARNIGFLKSSGDIIAYCDADSRPKKDWVENIIKDMKGNIAVYGSITPYDGSPKTRKKMKIFGNKLMKLTSKLRYPTVCTANFAVRRDIMKKYKFRFKILEDFDFGNRIRKEGRVRFYDNLEMPISSRRYEKNLAKLLLIDYLLNWVKIKMGKSPSVNDYFKK